MSIQEIFMSFFNLMTTDYVTWKIVPKLDYLNKEGMFITG